MTNEELKELEIIVEKFDNIDINNLNSLRDLKYSKIPSEKLLKLVELAKQNNKRALTILVKYYYPFILSIVFNYNIEGIDLNDVAMAAVNGFIEGIKKDCNAIVENVNEDSDELVKESVRMMYESVKEFCYQCIRESVMTFDEINKKIKGIVPKEEKEEFVLF